MQQLYVERLKANIVEVKQVGKVRSLRDDKQDVAFLGFGVGYGEPETMWTDDYSTAQPNMCSTMHRSCRNFLRNALRQRRTQLSNLNMS